MARELLTKQEKSLVDKLGNLQDEFFYIMDNGETRDDDMSEVLFLIHSLQARVLSNAASRRYPKLFRKLGETP